MRRAVLVHGFLGSPADWADVLAHLAAGIECECVALRDLDCASIESAALALIARLERCPCDVLVGYSLGGRIALEALAQRPTGVPRLVLLSTSAGIADAHERTRRSNEDEARAVELRAHGISAFVEQWYQLPLFAPFRAHASFALARARREGGDAAFWATCIAACSPGRAAMRRETLISHADRITLAVGALDERYAAAAQALASFAPRLTLETIAHAGHVLPFEAPERVARLIEAALEKSP